MAVKVNLNAPPAAWFQNPKLSGPTPFTVDAQGRVFGHLATWSVCHIGLQGKCVQAPKSRSKYAYFRTGQVLCADGSMVPVGRITAGTGHAGTTLNASSATSHYDNTGFVGALVACGEDAHGIWVAGSVRAGLSAGQLQTLRAAPLSGDWRGIGGSRQLELVGALSVNVPGFPVPQTRALLASGVPVSLIAAGVLEPLGRSGVVEVKMSGPVIAHIIAEQDKKDRQALKDSLAAKVRGLGNGKR